MADQHRLKTVFFLAALFLAALVVFFWQRSSADDPASVLSEEESVIVVSTAAAQKLSQPVVLDAAGSFVAEEASDVAPHTSGHVLSTPVDVGDFVQQGQILVKLDGSQQRLRVEQARAQLAQAEAGLRQARSKLGLDGSSLFDPASVPETRAAQAQYESAQAQAELAEAEARRYAQLLEGGNVSRSSYEQFRNQAETARAQAAAAKEQYEAALNAARQGYQGVASSQAALESARTQLALSQEELADTVIRAPFSGYVSARTVSRGEFVSTSSPVVRLVRLQPIRLELQVPQSYAGGLELGMTVLASTSAFPQRRFEGRIKAINPAVSPESRAITVEAEFSNADRALKPGLFATAQIELPVREDAVYVPAEAVQSDENTNSAQVYVIEQGRARLRVVQAAGRDGLKVRVRSGLSGGEIVATSNLDELYDGAPVNVRTSERQTAKRSRTEREPARA